MNDTFGTVRSDFMSTKHLAAAGIAAAMAISLTACGGSSSSSAKNGPSSGTPSFNSSSASSAPSASASALPKAALAKIVLQTADLPTGWKGTPSTDDSSGGTTGSELAKCVGAKDTDSDQVASANSDDFVLGQQGISSEAESFRSQADVDSDSAVVKDPKFVSCFETVLKQEAASDDDAQGVKLISANAKFIPPAGDAPKGYLGELSGQAVVAANGKNATVYIKGFFLADGLTEADVSSFSAGAPVSDDLMLSLVQKVSSRLTS